VNQPYDFIIAGAGASGLSLAWKMLHSPLGDKKVLIVDSDLNPKNDKTWCFWDNDIPPFSNIIYHKWTQVEFSAYGNLHSQSLAEYPYYCLRSIDFRKKILDALQRHPNFDLLETSISELVNSDSKAILYSGNDFYEADYIFQSCFEPAEIKKSNLRYPLLQHFLGWEINIEKPLFDASTFTLMDFDETFKRGVGFIYLLPWSKKTALIEYTIFSDELVDQEVYEEKISLYLNNRFNLKPIEYQVSRKELGRIPMQDRPYIPWYKPRIVNLGIAGSITKPSTGYTFKRIQDHTDSLIQGLIADGRPSFSKPSKWRYKAYDLWLLQIIHDHPVEALKVFYRLFQNNPVDELFQFLGEDTNLLQDLRIMSSVPYLPFLRAIWKTKGRLREL